MFGAALSYTCPSDKSICYSVQSPPTHAAFQDLQSQVNKFARPAGFSAIAVDGLIGEGTASATRKALAYAEGRLPDSDPNKQSIILLQPFATSRQALAGAATSVSDALRRAAIALGLTTSSGGGGGGGGGSLPPTTIPTIPPVFPSAVGASWWAQRTVSEKATMGVGGVAAVGFILIVMWPKIAARLKRRSAA